MRSNEAVSDSAQDWIPFSRRCELIAECLPLSTFPNTRQTDAEGLENSPDMAFKIFAQADQLCPSTDQAAEPI